MLSVGKRHPSELMEFVHHPLEPVDLFDDGLGAFVADAVEDFGLRACFLKVFDGDPNGKQRVLDFMRNLPRHIPPRGDTLRADSALQVGLEIRRHPVDTLRELSDFVSGLHLQLVGKFSGGYLAYSRGELMNRFRHPESDHVTDNIGEQQSNRRHDKENQRQLALQPDLVFVGIRDDHFDGGT